MVICLCYLYSLPWLPWYYDKPIVLSHADLVRLFVLLWQVFGEDEWSFGYCEQGSGVFSCPSGQNPMYTYRESIVLGKTNFSIFKVNQIIRELSREWPGTAYDLLSKNCNHFCDEFCERLDVPKLPGKHDRTVHYHFFIVKDKIVIFGIP